MTEHPRDRAPETPETETTDPFVHTRRIRESGTPATGFIVGGLVVAVAIIAFILFGGDDGQQSAQINMPPEAGSSADTAPAPEAPPANSAPADGGSTGAAPGTPPASDGTPTN